MNGWKIKKEVRIYSIKQLYMMCIYNIRYFRMHVMIENWVENQEESTCIQHKLAIYDVHVQYTMSLYASDD